MARLKVTTTWLPFGLLTITEHFTSGANLVTIFSGQTPAQLISIFSHFVSRQFQRLMSAIPALLHLLQSPEQQKERQTIRT